MVSVDIFQFIFKFFDFDHNGIIFSTKAVLYIQTQPKSFESLEMMKLVIINYYVLINCQEYINVYNFDD